MHPIGASTPYLSIPYSITRGSETLGSNIMWFVVTIKTPLTTPYKQNKEYHYQITKVTIVK